MRRHYNLPWISAALLTLCLTAFSCGSLSGKTVSGEGVLEDEVQVADSSQLLPPAGTATPEPYTAREADPKTWQSLSDGVKFAVAFFGILVLYFIVRALINRSRSREEIIIHRKENSGNVGSGGQDAGSGTSGDNAPTATPGGTYGRSTNRGRTLPYPPRETPPPGESAPGPTRTTRKGSWVPLMILGLALINLIRQCIMRN